MMCDLFDSPSNILLFSTALVGFLLFLYSKGNILFLDCTKKLYGAFQSYIVIYCDTKIMCCEYLTKYAWLVIIRMHFQNLRFIEIGDNTFFVKAYGPWKSCSFHFLNLALSANAATSTITLSTYLAFFLLSCFNIFKVWNMY